MRSHVLRRAAACLGLLALVVAACGDEPIGNVGPAIRVIPTHVTDDGQMLLDYGPIPVLRQKQLELLVRNDGRAPLNVHSIALAGEGAAFRTELAGPIRIPAAGQEKIAVTFQPPAESHYEGRLVIEHDDERKPPFEVILDGTGSTVGRIQVEPRALDFGRVGVGTQEVRPVTVRSMGTAPLLIESIEFTGAAEFSILGSTTTPAELYAPEGGGPGGVIELLVACAPTEATEGDELAGSLVIRSTDPEEREVVVQLEATVNRAPVAVIGPVAGVPAPGDTVALDGTGSYDVDGDEPLSFAWRLFRSPLNSNARIDDPHSPTPNLITGAPGIYVVGLDVEDAAGLSCLHPAGNPEIPCATREVTVKPADDLYFELVWDHDRTDLDLHLLDDGYDLYSTRGDCYYGNPEPDFGTPGDLTDNPRHTRDALTGPGPERIVFSKPPTGRFQAVVVFAKENGAPRPASTATLRIYVYGVLEAEITRTLERAHQRWNVATIDWPGGAISTIDTVEELPR